MSWVTICKSKYALDWQHERLVIKQASYLHPIRDPWRWSRLKERTNRMEKEIRSGPLCNISLFSLSLPLMHNYGTIINQMMSAIKPFSWLFKVKPPAITPPTYDICLLQELQRNTVQSSLTQPDNTWTMIMIIISLWAVITVHKCPDWCLLGCDHRQNFLPLYL